MSFLDIDMKTCNKCKHTKAVTDFRPHKETKDKLTTYCKPCLQAQSKAWAEKNKNYLNDWYATYRKDNQHQIKLNQKKWREVNKGKKNSDTALRVASKMQRTPKWLSKEQKKAIKEVYVMAKELETVFPWSQCVDHIVPLRGEKVCGLHVPWNLQILSAKDNMEKGNRYNG
jgi:hypothetical protein